MSVRCAVRWSVMLMLDCQNESANDSLCAFVLIIQMLAKQKYILTINFYAQKLVVLHLLIRGLNTCNENEKVGVRTHCVYQFSLVECG